VRPALISSRSSNEGRSMGALMYIVAQTATRSTRSRTRVPKRDVAAGDVVGRGDPREARRRAAEAACAATLAHPRLPPRASAAFDRRVVAPVTTARLRARAQERCGRGEYWYRISAVGRTSPRSRTVIAHHARRQCQSARNGPGRRHRARMAARNRRASPPSSPPSAAERGMIETAA